MTSTPVLPAEVDRSPNFLADLLESAARLPLRFLQFPLAPFAVASLTACATALMWQNDPQGLSAALLHFGKRAAITFGIGALAVIAVQLWPKEKWPRESALTTGYLRQVLVLAMLWQAVATVLVLRPILAWLRHAHELFQATGMTPQDLTRPDVGSGLAGMVALAIYFWPVTIGVAAVVTLSVAVAVIPAALRRSQALPRLLLAAALTQAAYWGGAVHVLDLADRTLTPFREQVLRESPRAKPANPSGRGAMLDAGEEKRILDFLGEHVRVGRPAVSQLGWLLIAPWLFVPAIWWRPRKRDEVSPYGTAPHP